MSINWTYKGRAYGIPERMEAGITRYVLHGIPPGHFLQAVLKNNLEQAIGRADDENLALLSAYIRFLYNSCPHGCYGGEANYLAWIAQGGLSGEAAREQGQN